MEKMVPGVMQIVDGMKMIWDIGAGNREGVSGVDTAWLRMDRRTNLMMIVGVLMFEERMDVERLSAVLEERFLHYDRFKQRVVKIAASHYWETDSHFSMQNHLQTIALPGDAGKAELENLVSDLTSTPLDMSKPLWQFHLVENYNGGSALVARIHHCYADGISLIRVLLSMTDGSPRPVLKKGHHARHLDDHHHDEGDYMTRLYRPVASAVNKAMKTYWDVVEGAVDIAKKPSKLMKYSHHGIGMASDLARVLTMPNDPKTKFKGRLSTRKRCVWADSISLSEVKHVGKALGCTINDVLISCVTGALRGYLIEKGQQVDGLEIRATVPVNMRPEHKMDALGNYFGLVFLALPIGIENPFERLYEIQKRMCELKNSYEAVLALGLLAVCGMAPNVVEQTALGLLTAKATAVLTNVPGPKEAIYMAGNKVVDSMFWVPQSGDIGMGISILSYQEHIQFGLMTDTNLVPDPEGIICRFQGEFEKLLFATLMAPWDEPFEPKKVERDIEWISTQFSEGIKSVDVA